VFWGGKQRSRKPTDKKGVSRKERGSRGIEIGDEKEGWRMR
jgi:hypothetical protein